MTSSGTWTWQVKALQCGMSRTAPITTFNSRKSKNRGLLTRESGFPLERTNVFMTKTMKINALHIATSNNVWHSHQNHRSVMQMFIMKMTGTNGTAKKSVRLLPWRASSTWMSGVTGSQTTPRINVAATKEAAAFTLWLCWLKCLIKKLMSLSERKLKGVWSNIACGMETTSRDIAMNWRMSWWGAILPKHGLAIVGLPPHHKCC